MAAEAGLLPLGTEALKSAPEVDVFQYSQSMENTCFYSQQTAVPSCEQMGFSTDIHNINGVHSFILC